VSDAERPEPGGSERADGDAGAPAEAGRGRALLGWALAGVAVLWAAFLHHGLGPYPDGPLEPWSPREFLLRQSWITPFEESPALAVVAFSLPAALLLAAAAWLTRSAVARTLALAAVFASALFAFYGLRPPGPSIWNFFHWRGSAVMVGLALLLAATVDAPLLARSWLRLPTAGRVAVYLPVLVGAIVMMRNVTGTDPTLRFAISPWPVVPLFGAKIGSVAILGVIGGMAFATWSFAAGGLARRVGGVVVALLIPALWFKLWHGSFPVRGMAVMTVVAAVFVAASLVAGRSDALSVRARHLAWGFLLAVVPLVAGEAWATFDYTRTREGTARRVIDALAEYYDAHQEYPEELTQLVEEGHLERVPKPQIGFSFIESQDFQYQSFGTSYNLEFSSPDWVQCAYNPAWSEDYDDYDDYEEEAAEPIVEEAEAESDEEETSLGESWSCPSSPPELW
jgi:hypothetical protein